MLDRLPVAKTDSLMELGRLMKADPRPMKVDLGVGTYRDEAGTIPIMRVVKTAERSILETQTSKGYLGPSGDADFCRMLQDAFFPDLSAQRDDRVARIQTPGGTGALRLALQIAAEASPSAAVWIGTPTWPAHIPLVQACGLRVETYPHLDASGRFDASAMAQALSKAAPGDVILIHGCCHNPTGVDLDPEMWGAVAAAASQAGVTPLVDLAYPGLGDGLEEDVQGARTLLDQCPNLLMAVSCSKTFGLYRDRAGMLLGVAQSAKAAANFGAVAASQARLLWSNPPDHGAAIVKTVLSDEGLTADWRLEIADMRERVNGLRAQLAALDLGRIDLGPLEAQRGMFAMLPLEHHEVVRMRQDHAVYMDASGRINVAGLNAANIDAFVTGLRALAYEPQAASA
ncbi:aromatic amino acid transaminase [Caulobacter segnis]|uniref:aromatic amino acid transaminase n=1 Tax=Caulobacter segnis TaxID=88688 RepID=UPI00240EFB7C|nr:aromatic amino acid transaminase [Caulobacter segnis]MDG2522951.1 aromatic amino acid transaminase [Caulobacter segnis]